MINEIVVLRPGQTATATNMGDGWLIKVLKGKNQVYQEFMTRTLPQFVKVDDDGNQVDMPINLKRPFNWEIV